MTRLFGWPVSTVADNSCRGASTLSYSVYLWMVQCIVYPPKLLSPSDMFDVPTQRILGRPLVCGSSSKRRQLTLKSHRQRLDCPSLSATAVCDLLCKVQDHLDQARELLRRRSEEDAHGPRDLGYVSCMHTCRPVSLVLLLHGNSLPMR